MRFCLFSFILKFDFYTFIAVFDTNLFVLLSDMKKIKIGRSILIFLELLLALLLIFKGAEEILTLREAPVMVVLGNLKAAIPEFFKKIGVETSYFYKLILIVKGLFIVGVTAIVALHLLFQNIKDNTFWFHVLYFIKLIIVYVFLFQGLEVVLNGITTDRTFDLGGLFSFSSIAKSFQDIRWLPIWIIFFLAGYDLIAYLTGRSNGDDGGHSE